jgi:hypothetical protein
MIGRVLIRFLLLFAPCAVGAQSSHGGRLVEASSGRPMACWRVSLIDSVGTTLDSTVTNQSGAFRFGSTDRSALRLLVQQPGLIDYLSDLGALGNDTPSERTFRIPLQPDSAHREPTRRRAAPEPREGTVYYTFVVDTLGRIDVSSAFLVSAPTPALARRVERGLASMRLAPWRPTPGQSCQRVVQPFVIARQP